jgi:hypothetical protein
MQRAQLARPPPLNEELTEKVVTSEIRKYHVNQQVSGMGDGFVSGFIHKIVPHSKGSTSGPGTLYIGLMLVQSTHPSNNPYLDDDIRLTGGYASHDPLVPDQTSGQS